MKHKKDKDTVESIEDHYPVNFSFIHWSYHITSKFAISTRSESHFYACVGWRCFTSIVMILSVR